MAKSARDIDLEIDRDLGIKQPRTWTFRSVLGRFFRPLAFLGRPLRGFWALLMFPVVPRLSFGRGEKLSAGRRMVEGIFTRVIFSPFLAGAFSVILVWYTTHPTQVLARQTPGSLGLYYRQAPLISSDGQGLQAWYVPGLTTDEVLRNGEDAVRERRPAVILVHGLGMTHDQYLPLAAQLHESGFAVLLLSLRGQGESAPGAVTFGLRERFDVLAAVNYLRDVPQVDSAKICVVGYGMGATAVLQASLLDNSLAAVVAEAPLPSFESWTRSNFEHPWMPTTLLTALYDTTFELTYRERTGQLDLEQNLRHLRHAPLLLIAHNTPEEAPVQMLLSASGSISSPHQVVVMDPTEDKGSPAKVAATITGFLAETVHWTPAEHQVSENLRKLMEARVK